MLLERHHHYLVLVAITMARSLSTLPQVLQPYLGQSHQETQLILMALFAFALGLIKDRQD